MIHIAISVSDQVNVFLCSVIGGMVIAFIYDAFRIKRKAVKTGTIAVYIEDLLYWVIIALVMFAVIYFSNDGEFRGYIFIGAVIGAIFYMLVLSRIVMRIVLFFIRIACKTLVTVWNITVYPMRVLFDIVKTPAIFLLKILRRLCTTVKGIGKSQVAKTMFWRRMLKNIKNKI